ncbi:hypothetical protein ABK040_001117 [Willaertia magna]
MKPCVITHAFQYREISTSNQQQSIVMIGSLWLENLWKMITSQLNSLTSLSFNNYLSSSILNNRDTDINYKNNQQLLNLSNDNPDNPDKDNSFHHPLFICFFVFYFFGFCVVSSYTIYLIFLKLRKLFYYLKNKFQKNFKNKNIKNLYQPAKLNRTLQYLFYIQIIPFFLIRCILFFLIGFDFIPNSYFNSLNNWSHSQILLSIYSLSEMFLHNTYFLIAFFWIELELFYRGYANEYIQKRQRLHLIMFIIFSLLCFSLEIILTVLIFLKCYPDLYTPIDNSIWFTWIVRIDHSLHCILSLFLVICFTIYLFYNRKQMWNLYLAEGLKVITKRRRRRISTSNNNNTTTPNKRINNNNNIIDEKSNLLLSSAQYNSTVNKTTKDSINSYSSVNNNRPKLINRMEKTKKLLIYSMIICILVYLFQSIFSVIFTEIFIAIFGNGYLVLLDSYMLTMGIIYSLSDFTPFLMCYIFHKSNNIVKDLIKEEELENEHSNNIEEVIHIGDNVISYDDATSTCGSENEFYQQHALFNNNYERKRFYSTGKLIFDESEDTDSIITNNNLNKNDDAADQMKQ